MTWASGLLFPFLPSAVLVGEEPEEEAARPGILRIRIPGFMLEEEREPEGEEAAVAVAEPEPVAPVGAARQVEAGAGPAVLEPEEVEEAEALELAAPAEIGEAEAGVEAEVVTRIVETPRGPVEVVTPKPKDEAEREAMDELLLVLLMLEEESEE